MYCEKKSRTEREIPEINQRNRKVLFVPTHKRELLYRSLRCVCLATTTVTTNLFEPDFKFGTHFWFRA